MELHDNARRSDGGALDLTTLGRPVLVTGPDDPRIADYVSLTEPQLRSRTEPLHGLFIAEGELVIRRAVAAGHRLRSILVDIKRAELLADLADGQAPLFVAEREVLARITGFDVHRGVLASLHRPPPLAPARLLATARSVVVVEDVNNHTNLGVIFRTAAGLGIDGILLSPTCVDPLYRRSVRVSMGQVFAVPYARLAPWPAALTRLRDAGFSLLALTPASDAVELSALPDRPRRRPALIVGAEGPGLTEPVLASADYRVSIPMHRGVDSVNVAVATGIACYELMRLR